MRGKFLSSMINKLILCVLLSAPFPHFASLVAAFFEAIGGGELEKTVYRSSFHGPIMVSPMYLLSCFPVLVLDVEILRTWNKAQHQVGKKGHNFPWMCSGCSI